MQTRLGKENLTFKQYYGAHTHAWMYDAPFYTQYTHTHTGTFSLSLSRAGCKMTLCLLHYPCKIKLIEVIYSFSLACTTNKISRTIATTNIVTKRFQ